MRMTGVGPQSLHYDGGEEELATAHAPAHGNFTSVRAPELDDRPAAPFRGLLIAAGLLAFIWLALSAASISLLISHRSIEGFDLVDWAAVAAGISAPLALIGVASIVALRIEAARSGRRFVEAERLFSSATEQMRLEIEGVKAVMLSIRSEMETQKVAVGQQAQQLLAAGEGFAAQITSTSRTLSSEASAIEKIVETLNESTSTARIDMGVLIADLPKVEALARAVSGSFREAGIEAQAQAGSLEARLEELASHSGNAQELASAAGQRIAAQISQIESSSERARQQLETLAGRLSETVDSALTRTAEAVELTRRGVTAQGEALVSAAQAARNTLTGAGIENAESFAASIAALNTELSGFDMRVADQEGRIQDALAMLGSGLGELEDRLATLGEKACRKRNRFSIPYRPFASGSKMSLVL